MTIEAIERRVAQAIEDAGRAKDSVTLIAVSKVQPLDRLRHVLDSGHRVFGENKVQETQGKWPDLRADFPDVTLHLLGPLQTNKARAAVTLFDAIHTVDRLKLVTTLARLAQERGQCPELFIQVNTGAEPQKAGILPQDADSLIAAARAEDLPVRGLMCIPPADEDPVSHFTLLREIAARNDVSDLSMGMSSDFETAIAQGATHVRVGSAIFGERVPV